MTTETIDHETGEVLPAKSEVPAPARPPGIPTPYNSAETGQIGEAFARAQGEMEMPKRVKKGHFGYYAPLEEVARVLKEPFSRNGLSWHQGIVTRGGEYFIRTYIRHTSGEWFASDYPMLADKPGPQGFAGGVTFARRYGLTLATALCAEDDDDGETAQTAAQSPAQPRQTQGSLRQQVEVKLNGQATQPPPAAMGGDDADAQARLAYKRIQQEINDARSIDILNVTGLHAREPAREYDGVFLTFHEYAKQLIDAAAPGVWQRLVDRDTAKRFELAGDEP